MMSDEQMCSGARERRIRAELGRGNVIPGRLREALELVCGIDLTAVRLHDDEGSDGLAAAVDAEAFTTGADVFFRAHALRLNSDAGVRLLAHEIAHVAQQSAGRQQGETLGAELEAELFADAFVSGRLRKRASSRRACTVGAADRLVLQRHSSWEHRMLGDLRKLDFGTIAGGGANRKAYLQRVQQFLYMWFRNPTAVTADRIKRSFPEIRPLQLRGSGLVVTYGELNTLADYLATPAELDRMPAQQLLPILQQVRQEGYAWVTWVIEERWLDKKVVFGGFEGSIANTLGNDTADALWESHKMEGHTEHFGPRGIDHYSGLLARNACHFAPHSWYRWEQFYLQARAFAVEAHRATGARRERLVNLAWIHHGYADHFLHDSFAAGHLVNKTLVMQWYLDWVGNTWTPVPDWDLVRFMNVARQPDLAGRSLYSTFDDPARRGVVRDPQTASEHWSLARRIAASGVRADGSTVEASYKRWMAFLGAGVVQLASNSVHDHFNSKSLWVSSKAHPAAYQIFGDNTMIQAGEGYQLASLAAQLSQRSLLEVINDGATNISPSQIAAHFPSTVHDSAQLSSSKSLEQWVYGFREEAVKQFDGLKNRAVGTLRLRLEPVNIDQTGGWRWEAVAGKAVDIAVGGDGSVWSIGPLESDGNGPVQKWDAASSSWKRQDGMGVRIAVDGDGVVWVVNSGGYSYRRAPGANGWERGALPVVQAQGGMTTNGLCDIAAGTDGSVWGLANATALGGHRVLRCIPGNGTHTWEATKGGAIAISVAPEGVPWVVNNTGAVMRMTPASGSDRYGINSDATWVDVSPEGRKALDVGLGVGPLVQAWISTDQGIWGWNGRLPNEPKTGDRLKLGWEDLGGGATRVATGPDGLPWVVNQLNGVWRLIAGSTATAAFSTSDGGKVRGTARATGGSLFEGEYVSINGSTDLSKVIVGRSGAHVEWIKLDRSPVPGVLYQLSIKGQGPEGGLTDSMYIYIEDEGGFTDYKQFLSRQNHVLAIDYNGTKAGIKRISWSDGDDPR